MVLVQDSNTTNLAAGSVAKDTECESVPASQQTTANKSSETRRAWREELDASQRVRDCNPLKLPRRGRPNSSGG